MTHFWTFYLNLFTSQARALYYPLEPSGGRPWEVSFCPLYVYRVSGYTYIVRPYEYVV